MAFLRTVARSAVLVGLCAAWLRAQRTNARVTVAPQGRPRIASLAPPPPPPTRSNFNETVFSRLPVIVTPDGSVFIDLGNGYQQVARTCPYAYGYGCQSYSYPFNASAYPYEPPSYEPPVYVVPYYPTPVYPSGGYAPYGYPVWNYAPPSYGCPPGCVDPWVNRHRQTTIPIPGPARAAPPQPQRPTAGARVLQPIHR